MSRGMLRLVPAFALVVTVACGGGEKAAVPDATGPPPSIMLVVLDTVRADAVSAYGRVRGITPAVDRLAATGLRYERAYANASWTLPSHASLFTGLLPSTHGVGWADTHAAEDLDMLAERLAAAGYETVGISENPWVSKHFNMAQGFQRFTLTSSRARTIAAVDAWIDARTGTRPFFLFVNITRAHAPYRSRRPDLLPPGVELAAARRISQRVADYLCRWTPDARSAQALWGLYLGGVARADQELTVLLSRLRAKDLARRLVIVVTADHGEYFGEHGLAQHVVGLHEPVLRVPLVVNGLPGAPVGVIKEPVQLVDLTASILSWARVSSPPSLAGVPLPERPQGAETPRPIIAEWQDPADGAQDDEGPIRRWAARARARCAPEDRVFGPMRALIRGTTSLLWYDRYPPSLFDLATDPGQRRDLAAARPDEVRTLTAELRRHVRVAEKAAIPSTPARPLGDEVWKRLRALGYVEEQQPHD